MPADKANSPPIGSASRERHLGWRGAHCVLAFEAVAPLRKRGFSAVRLAGGFPEWRVQDCRLRCLRRRN
jgi:hypothetical protein